MIAHAYKFIKNLFYLVHKIGFEGCVFIAQFRKVQIIFKNLEYF